MAETLPNGWLIRSAKWPVRAKPNKIMLERERELVQLWEKKLLMMIPTSQKIFKKVENEGIGQFVIRRFEFGRDQQIFDQYFALNLAEMTIAWLFSKSARCDSWNFLKDSSMTYPYG